MLASICGLSQYIGSAWTRSSTISSTPCLFLLQLLSLCALSTTGDTIEQYLMNMASPSPMLPAL